MKKVLLFSPHFDDAVLSAGQFLAGRPNADVCTVFAGYPKSTTVVTDYDRKCGFDTSFNAMIARLDEDDTALAMLQAEQLILPFLDHQYGEKNKRDDIVEQVIDQINNHEDYEFIVGPLGIGHTDHRMVSDILLDLKYSDRFKQPLYLWEDLPLRVVEPMQVPSRLDDIEMKYGFVMVNDFLGDGPIADKMRALWCYKSQLGTGILNPYYLYVPERFWKVT